MSTMWTTTQTIGTRPGRTAVRRSLAVIAAVIFATLGVTAGSGVVRAVGAPQLYYSWGQSTSAEVSANIGGTNTASWASGTGAVAAATGVATDGTYVYWASGQKIFRKAISASAGGAVTTFIDTTGWSAGGFGNRAIRTLAVDSTHIYFGGTRGYDGTSILRASLSTGLQDTGWLWTASSADGYGLAVDSSPTGYVYANFGNKIHRATKAASAGAPATVTLNWVNANVPVGSTNPVGMTIDNTYLYWAGSTGSVYRTLLASAGSNIGAVSVLAVPSGSVYGLGIDTSTGTLYFTGSVGASNTYTVYSGVPDENTPPTPSTYTTFTSTTGSTSQMVVLPAPAVSPTISTQPSAAALTVGGNLSLSVSASASDGGTLTYQWKKDGTAISGATSSSLTVSGVALSDAGSYTVVITNTVGSSTATTTSSAAVVTVTTPTTTTSTTVSAATTTVAPPTTVATAASGASQLVTESNKALLEAVPGAATALINGKSVTVDIVTAPASATTADLQSAAKEIVGELDKLTPAGASNPVKVVNTSDGAELTGLLTNPDDPTEKLNVPVESVKLLKAGTDSAVLIAAMNQTNLPATTDATGAIEVTRGGILSARAYGFTGLETGEIVLMSTPRVLSSFTVDKSGTYAGQVPLPKDIAFGSHTVVMATKNSKVSLGIKLVRTRMQFRIKRVIGTTLFKNRAGVKKAGGIVTVTGEGRCRATATKITMGSKAGACYITVKQAAKGNLKAVYYRFTVSVVKKLVRRAAK